MLPKISESTVFLGLKWVHRPNFNLRGFPATDKQFSDTSRVSNNSTQFWQYLPAGSMRFHRTRVQSYRIPRLPLGTYIHTSDVSGKPRLSTVLLTKGLYGVKFQWPPPGSLICLNGSQNSGKPVYLGDYGYVVKDVTQEQPEKKDMHGGRDAGRGTGTPCPGQVPLSHTSACSLPRNSPNPVPLDFCGGSIT